MSSWTRIRPRLRATQGHTTRLPDAGRGKHPGQAMVEFAAVSILFFGLVFGIIDFGRIIYEYNTLHHAVREGARYAKVEPSNSGNIRNEIIDAATGLTLYDVSASCIPNCEFGSTVSVKAKSNFTPVTTSFLNFAFGGGFGKITMTSESTVTIE